MWWLCMNTRLYNDSTHCDCTKNYSFKHVSFVQNITHIRFFSGRTREILNQENFLKLAIWENLQLGKITLCTIIHRILRSYLYSNAHSMEKQRRSYITHKFHHGRWTVASLQIQLYTYTVATAWQLSVCTVQPSHTLEHV